MASRIVSSSCGEVLAKSCGFVVLTRDSIEAQFAAGISFRTTTISMTDPFVRCRARVRSTKRVRNSTARGCSQSLRHACAESATERFFEVNGLFLSQTSYQHTFDSGAQPGVSESIGDSVIGGGEQRRDLRRLQGVSVDPYRVDVAAEEC